MIIAGIGFSPHRWVCKEYASVDNGQCQELTFDIVVVHAQTGICCLQLQGDTDPSRWFMDEAHQDLGWQGYIEGEDAERRRTEAKKQQGTMSMSLCVWGGGATRPQHKKVCRKHTHLAETADV